MLLKHGSGQNNWSYRVGMLLIFFLSSLAPFGAKLKAWNTHKKKYFINFTILQNWISYMLEGCFKKPSHLVFWII